MVNLRVENKDYDDLGVLVGLLDEAGFKVASRAQMHYGSLDSTDWRIYTRESGGDKVREIAFLSDASELLVRKGFRGRDKTLAAGSERSFLDEMLKNYDSTEQEIAERAAWWNKTTPYAAGAGALIGFKGGIPMMLIGAGVATGVWQSLKMFALGSIDSKLTGYLTDRNVRTGDAAVKYIRT